MRVLLINPNTSAHITERMAASARAALGPQDLMQAVTATGGPAAVRDPGQLAAADANAMMLANLHGADHDVWVLGISLDGAAALLRRRYPTKVVVGMTEAALASASLCAEGIGVLTLGGAMRPLYRQRVDALGLAGRVCGIAAPEWPQAFGASAAPVDPAALDTLERAAEELCAAGAGVVVLAGAVLCGYAEALTERLALPVIDGVSAAVGQARILHGLRAGVVSGGARCGLP